MYRLEQWKVVTIEDTRYESPELQRKVLAGRVYNNPTSRMVRRHIPHAH